MITKLVKKLTELGIDPRDAPTPSGVSRRDFLKAAGVTAVSVAVPAGIVTVCKPKKIVYGEMPKNGIELTAENTHLPDGSGWEYVEPFGYDPEIGMAKIFAEEMKSQRVEDLLRDIELYDELTAGNTQQTAELLATQLLSLPLVAAQLEMGRLAKVNPEMHSLVNGKIWLKGFGYGDLEAKILAAGELARDISIEADERKDA